MRLNGIDLNKLNLFCSVMRHGGYKGAAEELSISRSAISQSIHSFEGNLGVKLFHRVGTSLIPSPEAQSFYFKVLAYQQGLQTCVGELVEKTKKIEGVLSVGAYLEFAKSKLMPVIEDFMSQYPKVQLKLNFDSPSRLESLLEENKIDLSISIFPHTKHKFIESKKLYQEELVLVAPKGLLKKNPTPDDLKNCSIIDYFPNHLLFKRWWNFHFQKSFPKNIFIKTYAATADMVFQFIKDGHGIGVVPEYILESHSHHNLVVINPSQKKLLDYIWINQPEISQYSLACQAFISTLRKHFPIKNNL